MNYLKSLFFLTDSQDRKKLCVLLFLMLFTGIIELMGVGALFPFVKLLSDPSIIHSNHYLDKIYNTFSFSSQTHFLVFVGALIFLLILLKGVITCINNYSQAKFSAGMNNKISNKILMSYVYMEYSEFTSVNTSTLSKHLLYDIQNVVNVISAILNMVTSVMVGMALIFLMLLADVWAVIVSVLLMVAFLQLTVMLTRSRMKRLAKSNESNYRKAYKTVSETFSGIKDVKIFGVEKCFVDRYNSTRKILSSHTVQYKVISNLPNVVMNVIGFGILMGVLLYLLISKGNMIEVLPIIAIIAICIQRLLPTIATLSASIGEMRKFKPVVFIITEAIKKLKPPVVDNEGLLVDDKELKFSSVIKIDNISYSYPESGGAALTDVSFLIEKNTTIGLVGESGAGKSTLVDVLLGLYSCSSGAIYCDNVKLDQSNYPGFRSLIGYVPQKTFLLDATIKENIAFAVDGNTFDEKQLEDAIRISQLKALIEQLPDGIDTAIGEGGLKLSGGQRQRIGIARALYRNPEILIMDEATNALDSATEKEFNESLSVLMKEKTIIIIAHRLSSIKFCDQLVQLENGKVVASGSYGALLANSDSFRRIYNIKEVTS